MVNFDYLKNLPRKQLFSVIGVTVLLLAIPVGVYLSQKTQIFKPRALETACQSDQTGTPVEEQCIDNTKVLVFSYSQNGACKLFYEPTTGLCSSSSPTPTPTPTATPTGSPGNSISADINGDGKVDILDFSFLLSKWGTGDPKADLNSDGKVDVRDYSILFSGWTR